MNIIHSVLPVCLKIIKLIRKTMCDRKYFGPEYKDYPLLSIYENGVKIKSIEGCEVLNHIAREINNLNK